MGFLKHLLSTLTQMPENIIKGNFYIRKNGEVYADVADDSRVRLNPNPDWNEEDENKLSYIANKPTIGTAASHDVTTEIEKSQDLPTANAIYNAIRAIDQKVENTKSLVNTPKIAKGIAEMTDTSSTYIYQGNEQGMRNGYWYFYNGEDWEAAFPQNVASVVTDKTLLLANQPADAKTVGDLINQLNDVLVEKDTKFTFSIDRNGHLIQNVVREDTNTTFTLQEGRMVVTYG